MPNLRLPDVNTMQLAGRLTRDPELRYTTNKKPMCKFCVAYSRKWGKGEDAKEDRLFLDCVAWGDHAEYIGDRIRKGDPVLVEGSLTLSEWTGKDGEARKRIDLNVRRCQPLAWDDRDQPKTTAAPEYQDNEQDLPF